MHPSLFASCLAPPHSPPSAAECRFPLAHHTILHLSHFHLSPTSQRSSALLASLHPVSSSFFPFLFHSYARHFPSDGAYERFVLRIDIVVPSCVLFTSLPSLDHRPFRTQPCPLTLLLASPFANLSPRSSTNQFCIYLLTTMFSLCAEQSPEEHAPRRDPRRDCLQ